MANDTIVNIIELPSQVLQEAAASLLVTIPKIITAILILFLGWVVAKISEIAVRKILTTARVDEWIKKMKLKESLYNISIVSTATLAVKYYILIIFLKEASVRAGLVFLSEMFDSIITAVPEIAVGIGILVIALLFADFVRKRVKHMVIPFNVGLSEAAYAIIMFFALVMALPKFGLTNTSLIEDSFKYIVLGLSVGISLAIGIGFGWAIKEGPAKSFFKQQKK